jgi:hypothetical protein
MKATMLSGTLAAATAQAQANARRCSHVDTHH